MDRPAVWSAPGRVNLIGEHTDYNEGFVLPFALPRRTTVAATRADSPVWTVRSAVEDGVVAFAEDDLRPGRVPGWAGYVAGVVWSLREAGVIVPFAELAVTSDLPVGAGLSSSAALGCATLAALVDLAGADLPRDRWPELARRAENAYVGVPCGILDQSAVVRCRAGHALFLDCRTGEAEHVPFDLDAAGLAMMVIETHAPHRHAGGEYATRRATCEAAAKALGVAALRDVTDLARLSTLDDELTRRRAHHVVTENRRVLQTMQLLRSGEPAAIGPLLTASHASLRDDFEVTVPELDVAVAAALDAGAYGARMTGGGFGGCVIALLPRASVTAVGDAVVAAFTREGFRSPTYFLATAGDGVHPG